MDHVRLCACRERARRRHLYAGHTNNVKRSSTIYKVGIMLDGTTLQMLLEQMACLHGMQSSKVLMHVNKKLEQITSIIAEVSMV